jgi:hypothetical protein
MGKHRKTETLQVRISHADNETLMELADERGESKSVIARDAIRAFIAQQKPERARKPAPGPTELKARSDQILNEAIAKLRAAHAKKSHAKPH